MKIDPDDPRVTAYALGEMEPSERPAFEKELQESPEALKEVEAIRKVAKNLIAELQKEPVPALSVEQRKAIEERLEQPARSKIIPFPWRRTFWWSAGVTALAACLIIGIFLPAVQRTRERSIASTILNECRPADAAKDKFAAKSGKNWKVPGSNVYYTGGHEKWIAALKTDPEAVEREVRKKLGSVKPGEVIYHFEPGQKDLKGEVPPSVRFNSADFVTEGYDHLAENEFLTAKENPLSTFSIDVDTASYSNIRRFLTQGSLPPKGAVRIEEMINYFSYSYAQPKGEDPFAVHLEVAECPWNSKHRLARIGIKGREIPATRRPAGNFVFLIDVSGSMQDPNKLPLLKRAFKLLVEQLNEKDHVAIAVYAGSSGLVLPSTSCEDKTKILDAIGRLEAGGCTNGGEGIQLAYKLATENFIKGGVNRVILATDGDFNVGMTDQDALVRLIEEKAKSGVFLSVLGFGMGDLKDSTMVKLADKGNGNYGYIDNFNEARKLFVEQLNGTLVTIAKDVKIQVEFNPAQVGAYRLVGYEKRMLKKEDFNDDKKDAGEIGAGHTVTALYEIVPAGEKIDLPGVDPLKYQRTVKPAEEAASDEMLTVKLRYKQPDGDKSKLLEFPVKDSGHRYTQASEDFKFASSVAAFGMLLRDSKFKGSASYDAVLELADESKGADKDGYRAEFLTLVRTAKSLAGGKSDR